MIFLNLHNWVNSKQEPFFSFVSFSALSRYKWTEWIYLIWVKPNYFNNLIIFVIILTYLREHSYMTSDVFWENLTYLPTYPHQILYYISLCNKIRWGLTYLPTQKSDVIYECSLTENTMDVKITPDFCS